MSNLITSNARAYVNWGRWVADCPIGCGAALKLNAHQETFLCPECRALSVIEWPSDPDGIWDALSSRPMPKTRNWFPSGHELALRARCPHGQTVAELREETVEHVGG